MIIRNNGTTDGFTAVTGVDGPHGDMRLDFGLLRLREGRTHSCDSKRERAFMLLRGVVEFRWAGNRQRAERESLFDENPWTLRAAGGERVEIVCVSAQAELCVAGAENPQPFEAELYKPADVRREMFGRGTLQDTSMREVRTVFDVLSAPQSALVVGESINYPGRWSSYPPHDHPQPEIYHYRFLPPQGFGVSVLDDDALVVRDGDTILIPPNAAHSQTSAPGYAMYYAWIIPHLPGNKFLPESKRFRPEHAWVLSEDAAVWTGEEGSGPRSY